MTTIPCRCLALSVSALSGALSARDEIHVGESKQVQGTDLTGKGVRQTALHHALTSHVFGPVILAITVNLLAPLEAASVTVSGAIKRLALTDGPKGHRVGGRIPATPPVRA